MHQAEPPKAGAGDRLVTAHSSGPERTVLTERGNADAWIASDLVVEPDE